jgi:hypothetical protein
MIGYLIHLLLLISFVCICSFSPSSARESINLKLCKPFPTALSIDRVWGGTRVRFSAVETNLAIYIGYYDQDRWLAISKVEKCTGRISKVRLPSRFVGWDAHNFVTLALDKTGRVHVAGNMHASPLVYSRMSEPDNLESMIKLTSMTGIEEERTTYPRFFRFPDGSLGFSYRSGQSGNGKEIINRFDGEKWTRYLDQPLFAPENEKQPVCAYHTGFIAGPDGFFHTAWVWRANEKAETNFHVNYARSRDLKTWEDSKGEKVALPLTPANSEIVDPIAQRSGLLNNIKLGFDDHGRVVISYLKFDGHGFSQLFHARREAEGWKCIQSTNWTYRWDFHGSKTILREISFTGIAVRDGTLVEGVRQPEIGNVFLKYQPETLKFDSVLKDFAWNKTPKVKRESMRGAVVTVQPVIGEDSEPSPHHAISWLSHPADNRDRSRKCEPEGLDCNFTSELQLNTVGKL